MEAANNKFKELIKKKFRGLNKISAKGLKAELVLIFDPQTWLEGMGYSPSDGVARHGDIVMGFDNHVLQFFVPPLPPTPLGVWPIPFLGILNVKNRKNRFMFRAGVWLLKVSEYFAKSSDMENQCL